MREIDPLNSALCLMAGEAQNRVSAVMRQLDAEHAQKLTERDEPLSTELALYFTLAALSETVLELRERVDELEEALATPAGEK